VCARARWRMCMCLRCSHFTSLFLNENMRERVCVCQCVCVCVRARVHTLVSAVAAPHLLYHLFRGPRQLKCDGVRALVHTRPAALRAIGDFALQAVCRRFFRVSSLSQQFCSGTARHLRRPCPGASDCAIMRVTQCALPGSVRCSLQVTSQGAPPC